MDALGLCFDLYGVIKTMIDNTTYFKEECETLSIIIEPVIQQTENWHEDILTKPEAKLFIKQLKSALEDSKKLIKKCMGKGKFARTLSATFKKDKYSKRFADLEKRLDHLQLPASLVNMVCMMISHFYHLFSM